MQIGSDFQYGSCRFSVWAPKHSQVTLHLTEENQWFELDNAGNGYWTINTEGLEPNTKYEFRLDGKEETKPDPASHYQPDGVFGPSAVIDHESFRWADKAWQGLDLKNLVFYELHVGTFTPKGTLKAIIPRLKDIAGFGINAVELMPLAQFSGNRNWGYDGVFPFSVQNTYGAPDDLKALINECHLRGIAVFVDFVYNHLGPEGNCLNDYGPYFPTHRIGRWGPTINLDGENNDGVRNYFLENTIHWFDHYHLDGIRLDAVLSMKDNSSVHFLTELNERTKRYAESIGKKLYVVAESGYNQPFVLAPTEEGGFGFDAQWLDDFQHALFAALTGEREGYYRHYGTLNDLMEVLSEAYFFVGDELDFKRRAPGESFSFIPPCKFIVFAQNHDQVGNRLLGDRLTTIAGWEAAKVAAGITLLSSYIPLLFMGEEYGETAPFMFFADYQGKALKESICEGRRKEFAEFHWKGDIPDPLGVETFEKSKINWKLRNSAKGAKIANYYRALIKLRGRLPLFQSQQNRQIKWLSSQNKHMLFIHKYDKTSEAGIVANFSNQPCDYNFPFEGGPYARVLDSADIAYDGSGSTLPNSAVKGDMCEQGGFTFAVYVMSKTEVTLNA